MVFGIADDGHAAAAGDHDISFRHALNRIIRAFGVNVGAQKPDQVSDIGLIKDGDGVDIGQRGQQLSTLVVRDTRPALSLDPPRARIGVDGDDELSAQLLGGTQIAHMAYVKKIEAAVGQNDAVTRGAPLPDLLCQLGGRKNFLGGLRQSVLHNGAKQFRAGYRSSAALHHHDAAGVVGKPGRRFCVGARSESGGISGDHRVAGAGHIGYLI